MEKVKVIIVMEGGMVFELEAQEEEPEVIGSSYEFYRSLVSGPTQFVDVHDNDTPQVVSDHPHQHWDVSDESDVHGILYTHFRGSLGHGLFPRESNDCIQEFSNLITGLFNGRRPYGTVIEDHNNKNDGSVMIRRFLFRIQRRGFWRSPYLARTLAHLPEQMGCCPIHGAPRLEREYIVDDDLGRFEHESYLVGGGDECPICLEGFEKGSEAARLACRHYFHRRCIARWVSVNYTCPCCRFNLVPDLDTFPPPGRYRYPDPPRYWLYPPRGILLDLSMA